MVDRGVVVRQPSEEDRREALIALTPAGEEALQRLSVLHWQELRKHEPALSEALQAIMRSRQEIETKP